MRVHFWGVRGSLPTPLSPVQLRNKITAVVQRITPQDLESEDARENFIQNLPTSLSSTIGGNTACVELETEDNQIIILDAGSGLHEMSKRYYEQSENVFHVFISHFHWDHIQGLPFFTPFYNKKSVFHFYSPWPATFDLLKTQMSYPFFPTKIESCTSNIFFHLIQPGKKEQIGKVSVSSKKMTHPGSSYAYSFEENDKKFVYATDVELTAVDKKEETANMEFFKNADMLILDAQYTIEELHIKSNWGHSSCCHCVDYASQWEIKKLYLFHHEPNYDDKKIDTILQTARWYADSLGRKDIEIYLAAEGVDVEI